MLPLLLQFTLLFLESKYLQMWGSGPSPYLLGIHKEYTLVPDCTRAGIIRHRFFKLPFVDPKPVGMK